MKQEKQPGKIPLYFPELKTEPLAFSWIGISLFLAMSMAFSGRLTEQLAIVACVIAIVIVFGMYGALVMLVTIPLYCYMLIDERNIEIFLFGRIVRRIPVCQIKLICAVGNERAHNLCVSTLSLEELAQRREEKMEKGVFSRQDLPFCKRRAGWKERFAKEYLLNPQWKDCSGRAEKPILWMKFDIVSILYLRDRYPHIPYLDLTESSNFQYCPGDPDMLSESFNNRVVLASDGMHIVKRKQEIQFIPAEKIKTLFRMDSFYSRGRYTTHCISYLIVSTLTVEEVARIGECMRLKKWRKSLIAAMPQAQEMNALVYLERMLLYGGVKGKLYPMYYTQSNEQKLRQNFPHARWVDVSDLWKTDPQQTQ